MSEPVDLSLRGNLALVRAIPYLGLAAVKDGTAPVTESGAIAILFWMAARVSVEREYTCYVLQETLTAQSCLSLRTLQRRLADLRKSGLLASKKRRDKSDVFKLNADAIFNHRDAVKARLQQEKDNENEF